MKKISVISLLGIAVLLSGCGSKTQPEQTISHSFLWGGLICQGTYTGEIKDQKPQGEGTFHGYIMRDGKQQDEVTYEGSWKAGKLNGSGIFTNVTEDVSYEGTFLKNNRSGEFEVRTGSSDGYETVSYKKDVPYGVVVLYDGEGQEIGFDRYYLGERVSEIMEAASKASYEELMYHTEEHYYDRVYLDCTVEEKVIQETPLDPDDEDSKTETCAQLKVRDKDQNIYLVTYNIEYPEDARNYMPEFESGEQVRIYGYVRGTTDHEGSTQLMASYPLIEGVAVQTGMEDKTRQEIPLTYENFADYAYELQGMEVNIKGTVVGIGKDEEEGTLLVVESDSYSDGEKRQYICCYSEETGAENQTMPVTGDTVEIIGSLQTVHVASGADGFLMYPKVLAEELR